MEVSIPIFSIGIKCKPPKQKEKVKTHIGMQIILNMLIGSSSNLYQQLYKEGILLSTPSYEYEFTDEYAHVLINGVSRNPEEMYKRLVQEIKNIKQNGINENDFTRTKKMIYGQYVKEYNDVSEIARSYGGGGHKNAAAFQIPKNGRTLEQTVSDFVNDLSKKIEKYEVQNGKVA